MIGRLLIIQILFMKVKDLIGLLKFIRYSYHSRGLLCSIKMAFYEILFDCRYKTDTVSIVYKDSLEDISLEVKSYGSDAQSVYYLHAKEMINAIDVDKKNSVFLDIGCGQARAIVTAAEQGFPTVIGIDYSKTLCSLCENNIKKYQKSTNDSKTIFSVINADAKNYEIPSEVNIIFMHNPFGQEIMEIVLANIDKSIQKNPRKIHILYGNPVCAELFLKLNYNLENSLSYKSGRIYANIYSRE
jgi:predicted RNA methylase